MHLSFDCFQNSIDHVEREKLENLFFSPFGFLKYVCFHISYLVFSLLNNSYFPLQHWEEITLKEKERKQYETLTIIIWSRTCLLAWKFHW